MREAVSPDLPVWLFGLPFNVATVFSVLVVTAILVVVCWLIGRRLSVVPRRLQVVVEFFYNFFYEIVEQALGKERARRFFPIYSTLFLFLFLSNMIGILPTADVEIGGEPYVDINNNGYYDTCDIYTDTNGNGCRDPGFLLPEVIEPTRDANTTIGLALLMAFIAHITQMRVKGIRGYIKDYFSPIPCMFPLNIVGRVVEVVSTSMRLFGNIFGGAVIILIAGYFTSKIVMPIPLQIFFGLFVGLIQAFVFTMLWISYLSVTIQD